MDRRSPVTSSGAKSRSPSIAVSRLTASSRVTCRDGAGRGTRCAPHARPAAVAAVAGSSLVADRWLSRISASIAVAASTASRQAGSCSVAGPGASWPRRRVRYSLDDAVALKGLEVEANRVGVDSELVGDLGDAHRFGGPLDRVEHLPPTFTHRLSLSGVLALRRVRREAVHQRGVGWYRAEFCRAARAAQWGVEPGQGVGEELCVVLGVDGPLLR